MGFFTEFFVRPRPVDVQRLRAAMALLEAMSPGERKEMGVRPADFPRIAREMAER